MPPPSQFLVSDALAWDMVQHQRGGPGSLDHRCVDGPLREEIAKRVVGGLADVAYRAQYDGQPGRLVLHVPGPGGQAGDLHVRLAGLWLHDLNLVDDAHGRALLERAAVELAESVRQAPMRGDWGQLVPTEPGLVVEVACRPVESPAGFSD